MENKIDEINETLIDSHVRALLSEAKAASNRQRELMANGYLFNYFSSLGLRWKETFHSRVIRLLLDPRTQHGCGLQFWNLFFECLKKAFKECEVINFLECHKVTCEYYIGPVSNDYEQGGSIDILIKTSNAILVIENKICASDQPKQLYRYANWVKCEAQKCKASFVFYLTPDGRLPAHESIRGAKGEVDVRCISYDFVCKWIDQCLNNCDKRSRVHMFLTQYLELVHDIIGKRKDDAIMLIKRYLIDKCSLAAAGAVKIAYDEAKKDLIVSIVKGACDKAGIEITAMLQDEIVRLASGEATSSNPCIIKWREEPYVAVSLAHDDSTILGLSIHDTKNRDRIINAAQRQGIENFQSTDYWPVHFLFRDEIFDDVVLDDVEKRQAISDKMAYFIKRLIAILQGDLSIS